jgi:hypothetical protein
VALISNPMELTGPLHRVEAALAQLCGDLGALVVLPGVHEGVGETNSRLEHVERELDRTRAASEEMAVTLEAIRAELGEVVRLLSAGTTAAGRTGADGAGASAAGAVSETA